MSNNRYPAPVVFPMDLTDDIAEYRIPGDDENVVRINSKVPNGMDLRVATNIYVAGVTFRLESVHNFLEGYNREVVLTPEPNNKYDKYAIAVHGTFVDGDGEQFSTHIGYVPAKLAKRLHGKDIAGQLMIVYLPTKSKGPGFRMDILEAYDLVKELENKMDSEFDGPPKFIDF